jgi:crotonobetainyl-CoA:carnitine CoA-transferase CaiB-like acyl-CoA transferase
LPLTGIRVLDLTRILAGPFCSMMLADMGADVIKVETPGEGDPVRHQGAIRDGLSWYFAAYNRNKRSITLDLRSREGRDILARLIAKSDVLVENYRPGILEKMGFGPERLKQLKPDLVYCNITGFGTSGPYRDRPAFDFIAQAMSGFMSVTGKPGDEPVRAGPPISDLIAGLYGALGVCAALVGRGRTGAGETVGASLTNGLISFHSFLAANYFASSAVPQRTGNDHGIASPYGLFNTSDGEVAISPSTEMVYGKLLDAIGAPELRFHPDFLTNALRVKNRAAINRAIEERLRHNTSEHWIAVLNAAGVPCGLVMDIEEVFADPQVRDQEMAITVDHPGHGPVRMLGFPLKFSENPCRVRRPAPPLGADTDEILREAGLTEAAIAALREKGGV